MRFRTHLAAVALAAVVVAPSSAFAADPKEPIVLEAHALGGAETGARPKSRLDTRMHVTHEMVGVLRPDGSVALECRDAAHAAQGHHDHRSGSEEIR